MSVTKGAEKIQKFFSYVFDTCDTVLTQKEIATFWQLSKPKHTLPLLIDLVNVRWISYVLIFFIQRGWKLVSCIFSQYNILDMPISSFKTVFNKLIQFHLINWSTLREFDVLEFWSVLLGSCWSKSKHMDLKSCALKTELQLFWFEDNRDMVDPFHQVQLTFLLYKCIFYRGTKIADRNNRQSSPEMHVEVQRKASIHNNTTSNRCLWFLQYYVVVLPSLTMCFGH